MTRKLLIVTHDVTALTDEEISNLGFCVGVQSEGGDGDYDYPGVRSWSDEVEVTDLDFAVRLGMNEIARDVAAGRVPNDITMFGQLHDYVDANEYGGLCNDKLFGQEDGFGTHDEWTAFGNAVQGRLNEWIEGGGLRNIAPPAPPRTILIHLNVEALPGHSEEEITQFVKSALHVGLEGADARVGITNYEIALSEEV